jgi:hypothetical protein
VPVEISEIFGQFLKDKISDLPILNSSPNNESCQPNNIAA